MPPGTSVFSLNSVNTGITKEFFLLSCSSKSFGDWILLKCWFPETILISYYIMCTYIHKNLFWPKPLLRDISLFFYDHKRTFPNKVQFKFRTTKNKSLWTPN